jgi:hypothetical protein
MARLLKLRRVGGITFGGFGRLGFSFWVKRKPAAAAPRSAWMDPA